jgi:hypothetical protein
MTIINLVNCFKSSLLVSFLVSMCVSDRNGMGSSLLDCYAGSFRLGFRHFFCHYHQITTVTNLISLNARMVVGLAHGTSSPAHE